MDGVFGRGVVSSEEYTCSQTTRAIDRLSASTIVLCMVWAIRLEKQTVELGRGRGGYNKAVFVFCVLVHNTSSWVYKRIGEDCIFS